MKSTAQTQEIPEITRESVLVPLDRIVVWSGNVRRTGVEDDIEALIASIAAHGLIQPLTVYDEGKFHYVVAGQRRLIALQKLADRKVIDKKHPVRCVVVAKQDALEIGIAENAIRADMHPADQYEAWRDLAEGGMSVADIAARFGTEETQVVKLLKLGRVAPELIDLYRDNVINLEELQAFTITDDQEEQVRVWMSLKGAPSYRRAAHVIREALTQDEVKTSDKRVKFIGLEAYERAGGTVRRDLFDEDGRGWVSDIALLNRLVDEKLAATIAEVKAEGWKWVEFRESFSHADRNKFVVEKGKQSALTPAEKEAYKELKDEADALDRRSYAGDEDLTEEEEARLEALNERIEQIDERPQVYTKAVMKRSGVIITLEYGGIDIDRGLTRKADAVKEKDAATSEDAEKEEPTGIPAGLARELKDHATAALQVALAENPDAALQALVFCAIRGSFSAGVNVDFDNNAIPTGCAADRHIDALANEAADGLPDDDYDGRALWDGLGECDTRKLLEILATHTARTADIYDLRGKMIASYMGVDIRKWFTPDAENYFGSISKAQILADLKEMGADRSLLSRVEKMKKDDAAEEAAAYLAKSAPDWLPVPMRVMADED